MAHSRYADFHHAGSRGTQLPVNINRDLVFTGFAWVGFVAILSVVPWLFPPPADLPNTASMQGYNISLAYLLTMGWVLFSVLLFGIFGNPERSVAVPLSSRGPSASMRWAEVIVVACAVALFYWPAALARFGPHVEDTYFLAALWRMACGQVPYTDFEFLYGPAMIHIPGWWQRFAGFSMQSYYTVLMVLQVTLFIVIVCILQKFIPRFRTRLLAFLVLLPFFLDILFGLNWIAWRYFATVIVILMLAKYPRVHSAAFVAGLISGLAAAYSYEYGIAALLSGLAILITLLFQPKRLPVLINLLILIVASIVVWGLTVYALTGVNFSTYISSTLHIAKSASALGLGQFAFRWTLHSLALFFLLAAIAVMGGRSFRKLGRTSVYEGDLQLIGAAVFALVALKIAFQRADHLHLVVPFVPLILVLLLNRPRNLMVASPALKKAMVGAIVICSFAHTVGDIPLGRNVTFGVARGLLHEVTDRSVVGGFDSRQTGIHGERSEAKSRIVDIAARLNAPDLRDRPVMFYGGIWNLGAEVGVCPVGYSFYDILYSDERAPLVNTVLTTADLLIVMRERDYDRMFDGIAPDTTGKEAGIVKHVSRMIGSIHFTETRLETDIEYNLWKHHLGNELTRTHRIKERFAGVVLLEKNL